MPTSVLMPRLGESVTEGTVTRWLKRVGDHVESGEPLLEVSTDKVDTEVVSPATGTLLAITVDETKTVEIGVELGVVGDASATVASTANAASNTPSADAIVVPIPEARAGHQPTPASSRPSATPLVRKLAREHGVDLFKVSGTGNRGRIRVPDVLAAASAAVELTSKPTPAPQPILSAPPATLPPEISTPAAPARPPALVGSAPRSHGATRERVEPMSRTRQVIASRMLESLQTSAQLTTVVEVDVTRIARIRDRAKKDFEAREGVKLSFLPFFAVAALEALKQHPIVNASVDTTAKTITYHDDQHLGVAVDTDRGLLVPVIRSAGELNLAGIARKISDIANRTRTNTIQADELGGGTFTLTNTGSCGALFDTPIINPPQAAILGTGAVVRRAVVVTGPDFGEIVAVRSMVYLALSYDHRIVDGADAARFLVTIKERLEAANFEPDVGLT